MSRWLKSVNNLLERLDGSVEDVIQEREDYAGEDDLNYDHDDGHGDIQGVGGASSVDDILARRGLLSQEEHDIDDDDHESSWQESDFDALDTSEEEEVTLELDSNTAMTRPLFDSSIHSGASSTKLKVPSTMRSAPVSGSSNAQQVKTHSQLLPTLDAGFPLQKDFNLSAPSSSQITLDTTSNNGLDELEKRSVETNDAPLTLRIDTVKEDAQKFSAPMVEAKIENSDVDREASKKDVVIPQNAALQSSTAPGSTMIPLAVSTTIPKFHYQSAPSLDSAATAKKAAAEQKSLIKRSAEEAREATKEARKLRRNLVSLNSKLEAAEREMEAQQKELQRAADRMEKDRQRYKDEKERMSREHKEEMDAALLEHQSAIASMAAAHSYQLEKMEERIERAEETRVREEDDMNNELIEAANRESEVLKRVILLEDEKLTMAAQISTLQSHSSAIQSRLDSMIQVSEAATEREREADDRLDAALSLHARQLSQRQAREAELERAVADLGAALVVSRQREQSRLSSLRGKSVPVNDDVTLKKQLETVEDELETIKAQYILERQRSKTLQNELEDVSKERTQEASAALARQRQYDCKVADLSATVARLQSSGLHLKRSVSLVEGGDENEIARRFKAKEEGLQGQITSLSEQLLRQQSIIANVSTEVSTLRTRLRAALTRAETAEKSVASLNNLDSMYDVENATLSNPSSGNIRMRRRGGGGGRSRSNTVTSIRSALKLEPGRGGEATNQIGSFVDAIDNIAVNLGAFFRHNPLARGGFVLYLLILHIWSFCLLFFHAHHALDNVHEEFGDGNNSMHHHGPHALLNQSYRNREQMHDKT